MAKKFKIMAVLILSVFILSACNLPGTKPNPTPILFPTPNYTMTALFSQDSEIPPTITPPAVVVTQVGVTEVPTSAVAATDTPVVVTATPTSAVTNTPAATNTTQTIRGGQWVYAKKVSTAPTLDSVWDEWDSTKYPATYVVYGSSEWTNSADLEASFRVAWDSDYLYIAVKVFDDKYIQDATGMDIYKGDSLEILLDTNLYGDLNTAYLSGDDYQIGISPGKIDIDGEKEVFRWFPSGSAGGISGAKVASSEGDGVYRVEAAIPWSAFGVSASAGKQFGFGFSISDNDNPGEKIQQTMVSNLPYRSLTNPTTWTVLTLSN